MSSNASKHICTCIRVQNVVFALWKALLQDSHLSMFYSHLHCLVVAMCHKHTVIIHNSPQQNGNWACEGAGNVPAVFTEAGGPQVIYGHHVPVVPQQCTDDLPTSPRQINCPLSPQMGRRHNPSHPMLAAPARIYVLLQLVQSQSNKGTNGRLERSWNRRMRRRSNDLEWGGRMRRPPVEGRPVHLSFSLASSCSLSFFGLLNGGLLMVARLGQGEVSQRLEMTDVLVRDEGSRFLFHRFIFSHVKLSRAGMKKNRQRKGDLRLTSTKGQYNVIEVFVFKIMLKD